MRYLSYEELTSKIVLEVDDVFKYKNKNYIVVDGSQGCKNCPLKDICTYIDCTGGIFIKFKEISDIELLILKGSD